MERTDIEAGGKSWDMASPVMLLISAVEPFAVMSVYLFLGQQYPSLQEEPIGPVVFGTALGAGAALIFRVRSLPLWVRCLLAVMYILAGYYALYAFSIYFMGVIFDEWL